MSVLDKIRAAGWQIGAVTAGLAAVGLAVAVLAGHAQLKAARADRDQARAAIEAPVTGWAARLAQCQLNAGALQRAIDGQNAAIKANGEESARRLQAAAEAVDQAQRGAARAEAKVAALMKPLAGFDTCARVIEADQRLLESLK